MGGTLDNLSFGDARRATPGWNLDTSNDWRHDGAFVGAAGRTLPCSTALDKVPAFTPNNGAAVKGRLVMVNGIMTDVVLQAADLQAMANRGYEVVGVHNATKGLSRDLAQCLGDKLDLELANNAAVTTTALLIGEAVAQNLSLSLVGHSQGALVISRALAEVRDQLNEQGKTPEQVRQALGQISVTSLGGAAASYPEGPKFEHYYNSFDAVPLLAGRAAMSLLGDSPNETFHSFSAARRPHDLPPLSNGVGNTFARLVDQTTHGPRDIYIPRFA